MQRNVEANQVRAQQPIEQLSLPRANAESLGIGPWNMPEDRHASLWPRRFHQLRKQSQVVVLDKNRGVGARRDLLKHRGGEFLVHLLVVLPIRCTENGPRMRYVTKRPQPLV